VILIENLDYIATFDPERRVLQNASIVVEGPLIKAIGESRGAPREADLVVDGTGKIALPGFINTHHHFFQQLTRAFPVAHNATILDWLRYLYPIWAWIDDETIHHATLLAVAQLLLTGCTTTSDMGYLYPRGQTRLIDAEIAAARQLGIRFHPCRAAMPAMEGDLLDQLESVGVPAADLIEDQDTILAECERVIKAYDQKGPFSMCRVTIGQTDKTYRDPEFMRAMADLAERHDVMLHTHLHPRDDEIALCQALHGLEPLDFLEDTGWLGSHVWFAHATAFTPAYIERVAQSGSGVSHSPSSNMRLGYRCAPIPAMAAAGVKISVADGGSSNDTGDYLGELRQTLLVHRIQGLHPEPYGGARATTPQDVLSFGTLGGAAVLNREDIGSLEIGKAADIVLYDLSRLDYAGALHDPVAALLLCGESHVVDTTIVNGEAVVRNGRLTRMDESEIAAGANEAARKLLARASQGRA
jgi:cytosine/adenosine deaminase-related metal-dependent hydrolase